MNESQSTVLDLTRVEASTKQSSEYRGMMMLCGSCKKVISLEPGDTIYGGQWYHLACSGKLEDSEEDTGMTTQDQLLEEHRAQLKL